MATKASKAATNGAETIETAVKNGAAAVKDSFEKAAKGYDQFIAFSKDNADAFLKSANTAGKGVETINNEVVAYSRQALEESIAATKALLAAKTVNEFVHLQTDLAKSAFDGYVSQVTKVSDLAVGIAKEAVEPIQARFTAFAELVQDVRAA